ncbi:mucin 17, cell surface associated [Pseudocyphellaria aurata]|nr:mucin 17, cell surface associated [Pseudocyphellaria aurata]
MAAEKAFQIRPVLRDIAAYTMVVDLTSVRVRSVEGRKPDQFEPLTGLGFADTFLSFCRKTTLTKHFRRWHTDEETSSEEGSDIGAEDVPETPTVRQSIYYGDLWPLPGQSAQRSRPLSFQATLVSRPKSTESNTKVERAASVSSPADNSIPSANAAMTPFEYLRARASVSSDQGLVQATLPTNFHHGLPVSTQYASENGIETWTSPIDTKTTSSGFSEYSSTPSSAQSNPVYFNEPANSNFPLQVTNIALNEPMQYSQEGGATISSAPAQLTDGVPQGQMRTASYGLGPTSAPEQSLPFSPVPASIPRAPQTSVMPVSFAINTQYNIPSDPPQYYGATVPDWYLNVKPEESWPGALPTDYYWN